MKKLFYNLFTAALMCLAVTSCSQEEDIIQSSNDMTTFSVNLNGVPQSRTINIGNGELVNKLYYAVYQDEVHVYPTNADGSAKNGVANISDNKATLNLPILKGETYDIVFWAQAEGTTVYNISNLREIKVNYDVALSNQESYDAFYNALKNFKADGNNHRIELRRPFAQLNLGTSYKKANTEEEMGDWQKAWLALKDKTTAPVTHSSVTIDGLADTFAPLEGKATGDVEKTFKIAEIIKQTFKTKINSIENEYYNLSLNYLLVPGVKAPHGVGAYTAIDPSVKALVDVTYTLYRGENNELFKMNKISGVPVQRNFRTNIVGELLTGTGYDININPEENNPDTNQEIKNIKGLTELSTVLSNNTSTSPIIYNISGLSTTDDLAIEIPGTFVAEQVTFNINDIKDGAKLSIKDEDGSQYTNSVYVNLPTTEGHNLTSTNINLPGAHAELLVGNFGAATVITSNTTLVVGQNANVTTLTINGGNVEIQTGGVVEEIEVGASAGTILLALGNDVELPAGAEDNDQIILAGTDDAESTEETVYVAQVGDYKFTNLNEAIKFIPETGEIKMIADYTLASDDAAITIPEDKNITLDLNGCTISQTKVQTAAYSLIENKGTLVLKDTKGNGKISYADTGNGGNYGSNTIWNNGTLTIEGGLIENNSTETVASNGYPHPIDNYAILTINGGTITNNANYSSMRIWCTTDDNTIVTINGGTFNGAIDFHTPNASANKGTLTINDGNFTADSYTNCAVRLLGFGADVDEMNGYINGGIFNGAIKLNKYGNVTKFNSQVFFISGGTFTNEAKNATDETLLAEGCSFEENTNGTWSVKQVLEQDGEKSYIINDLAGLKAFRNAVNKGNTFEGCTITLKNDINLNNEQWLPIGYWQTFNGTFDGGNHIISNLKHHGTEEDCYIGLFGYTDNAVIRNLTIKNVDLKLIANNEWAGGHMGALVGNIEGTTVIENINVIGTIQIDGDLEKQGAGRIGGVVGGNNCSVTLKNVSVEADENSFVKGNSSIGGIAGQLQGRATLENIKSNINVSAQVFAAGGIIGLAPENTTFNNCSSSGNVSLISPTGNENNPYRLGGIAGSWADNLNNALTLTDCSYTGKLTSTSEITFDCDGYVGRGYGLINDAIVDVNGDKYQYIGNGQYTFNGYEIIADGLLKKGTEYLVSNANGLAEFSAKALTKNNGIAEEATIQIMNDIDMNGADFSAIIAQRGDKLTIVGNGHTISNVNVVSGKDDNTTGQASMFYVYQNSTLEVSDLTLKDIIVTADKNASGYAAAVVGYCEGTVYLENVDVENATITGVKSSGMLAGHMSVGSSLKAEGCDLSGTVTLAEYEANGHYAGTYIGTLAGKAEIINCTVDVKVSGNLNEANHGEIYGRKTADGSLI